MAFSNRGSNLPGIVAGVDFSQAQHRFIDIDAAGKAVLAGAGGRVVAALENNPALDVPASLMTSGSVAKVQASAAVALGADVASDADGKAITAVSGDFVVGTCVEAAGAPNELCSVELALRGGSAGALKVLDDAGRDALTPQPPAGTAIFNTSDNAPNYSDGTAWRDSDGTLT